MKRRNKLIVSQPSGTYSVMVVAKWLAKKMTGFTKQSMVLALVLSLGLGMVTMESGCGKKDAGETATVEDGNGGTQETTNSVTAEAKEVPELSKIQAICELSALKCYYHNVARSRKEAGSGFAHLGEKERKFWIEYTGVAEISYSVDKIEMKQEGNVITISLPEPNITYYVEEGSWSADKMVIENDQLLQKNPIDSEDIIEAINTAQEAMKENVESNNSIKHNAKMQAHSLIENYIMQIGRVTDVQYEVVWAE